MVKKRLFANGPDFEWDLKIGSPTVVYFDQVVKYFFLHFQIFLFFGCISTKINLKKVKKQCFKCLGVNLQKLIHTQKLIDSLAGLSNFTIFRFPFLIIYLKNLNLNLG